LKTIGIIGSGNLAWHLAHGFVQANGVDVRWIVGRNNTTLNDLGRSTNIATFSEVPPIPVSLILICVQDHALQDILLELPLHSEIAYTAGAVAFSDLVIPQKKYGVLYPLQTFSKYRMVDLSCVPFLIESIDTSFEDELMDWAKLLSNNVVRINASEREHIHLAAVLANNFVNHLLFIAQQHLQSKLIDPTLLDVLVRETVEKAITFGALEGQSGPARRNDQQTINKHIDMLEPQQGKLYKLITDSIIDTYSSQKTNKNDHL